MNILEYKKEDKEEIISMIKKIIFDEYKYYFWNKWLESKDWSIYEKNSKYNKMFYIKIKNKIISICSICKIQDNNYYINTFYTAKEYRNKGYGKILFDKCYNFAKENKATKILLCVDKYFEKAIEFYEKRGFVFLEEKEINELWYEKIL